MDKIELRHVSYSVFSPEGKESPILRRISFSVSPGESFTILGPSGCGKYTLLRLCNRLIDPTEGEILLNGTPVRERPVTELRRKIGLVLQTPVFMKDLSLRENLLYGLQGPQSRSGDDEDQAARLLEDVGLSMRILEQKPEEISVGQAQRLCLARTLATKPEVLLLDEPTSSLDPAARLDIERLVEKLRREHHLTALFVTHDLEHARRLGGQCGVLVEGRLIETGSIENLLQRANHELTRQFVSGQLQG